MKQFILILSALAILHGNSLCAQQADSAISQPKVVFAYDTVPNDPLHARIYHLDNGLTVYLSRNTIKPEIQTYIIIRAGGQNDPLESTGLAHYQEHIMFKGTSRYGTTDYAKEKPYLDAIDSLYEVYSHTTDEAVRKAIYHEIDSVSYLSSTIAIANEFDKLMSLIGAKWVNAYTSTNRTCYHEVIPAGELTRWAMIESGRFQDLVVRGFHTELETVYEEFNMYSTMDFDKIDQAINNILYSSIPYRQHSVIGTQEHLKNPSLKNIKRFYQTFYRPNNAAICLSGDLDYDHAIEVINTYFGSWQPNDNLQAALDENNALLFQRKAGLGVHKDTVIYGNEAPQLWMAWDVPNIHSEEIPVLDMLTKVLYNGHCGLIDLNINQKQKMLWGLAESEQNNDVSTFYLIGQPKTGQSLDNLRKLFLNQIKKLQAGEFSEDLLKAIVANTRREEIEMSDDNNYRAGYVFLNAFVYDLPYEQVIHYSDVLSKVTKEQIVAFANKYLVDNYACVMKQQKSDLAPVTIDKPAITPIEMNRDKSSAFVSELANIEPERLQPEFLDFDKDIQQTTLRKGQKLIYRHNDNNELFYLLFLANRGTATDPVIDVATDLIDYLGTTNYSPEAYEIALYSQAAQVDFYNDETKTTFRASSLQSHFDSTLTLLEEKIFSPIPNNAILRQVIADRTRQHNDNKLDQAACFSQLLDAGIYGLENMQEQITATAPKTLAKKDAAAIVEHLKATVPYTSTILYYGPASMEEVVAKLNDDSQIVNAYNRNQQPTAPEHNKTQRIKQPEVWVAPYKANNIYMVQYANPGVTYSPKQEAIVALFNEYFCGSMGSIVFQEMRESRALCYASYAGYELPKFAGDDNIFMTYIITQNDKLKDCVLAFDTICNRLPLSQAAFDQAKTSLLKQIENKRYADFEAISAYLRYTNKGWDHDWNKDIYDEVQRLTLKDLQQFQTQALTNLPYRYLILGDKKQLNRKFLKTLGPVKYLKLKDIFVY